MNYPYPIPGSSTAAPVYTGPYFQVGNECCNGGMTNDIDAVTKVVFDYTSQLPAGVGVASVAYEVTPSSDEMLVLTNKTLVTNVASFMVSGGAVGQSYSIEALASLYDGQVWVDHITVNVTDCDSSATYNPNLLFTYGPIIIANTLYYVAANEQTVFRLDSPDRFNRRGVLADSNVLVYDAGDRQVPVENYTVNVGANTITFMQPLAGGDSVVFDLVAAPPPPITPIYLNSAVISFSLYYNAVQGQTVFWLATPDIFDHVGVATSGALVSRNGSRLVPNDSYIIDVPNNRVVLTYPAADEESVIIDLISPQPAPVLLGSAIQMEYLPITTINVLPPLSYPSDGNVMLLFVDGVSFSPIGVNPAFSFSRGSKTLTWLSALYSVPVGAAVNVVYTHV